LSSTVTLHSTSTVIKAMLCITSHFSLPQFMLRIRLLVTGYSSWRSRFSSRVVHEKSVVDKVALPLLCFPSPPADYYFSNDPYFYISSC
jgi:hypothetical protein